MNVVDPARSFARVDSTARCAIATKATVSTIVATKASIREKPRAIAARRMQLLVRVRTSAFAEAI